jgi:cobalt-zinc-cadmium efflux system protein
LNLRGAYLHVVSDALGSIGVIGAALVIWLTGWRLADPLASLVVCILVIWGSWNVIRQSVNILLEGTPAHIDIIALMRAMQAVPGVKLAHDVHVWTITSGMEAMSGHIIVQDIRSSEDVIRRLNALLREQFGISHTTIQCETEHKDHQGRL